MFGRYDPLHPIARNPACFPRFWTQTVCGGLPSVATALLHNCSTICWLRWRQRALLLFLSRVTLVADREHAYSDALGLEYDDASLGEALFYGGEVGEEKRHVPVGVRLLAGRARRTESAPGEERAACRSRCRRRRGRGSRR